jgi:enoyl-CoA hydratase/carnithine racemase
MSKRVTCNVREWVADVRLNRPAKMNALDPEMRDALIAAAKELSLNKSVRVVVLSGEGKSFCAGLDLKRFQAMAEPGPEGGRRIISEAEPGNPANLGQQAALAWQVLPVPVIAAVHGVAFGGGLQIALGSDIRIVAPDARLSVMEIKWGLVPDMGGTQLLRHVVGLDVLKELTFTGRIVSGNEAVDLGLATRASENPYQEAMRLAHEIASKSPDGVRAGKRLLNASRIVNLEEGLRLEVAVQKAIISQPNQVEAVQSNLEKRKPKFID